MPGPKKLNKGIHYISPLLNHIDLNVIGNREEIEYYRDLHTKINNLQITLYSKYCR